MKKVHKKAEHGCEDLQEIMDSIEKSFLKPTTPTRLDE